MKAEVFTLCHEAKVENGNLHVKGAFNHISTDRLPATINNRSLALRLCFTPDADMEGTRQIVITIVDADGKPVDEITEIFKPARF